MRERITHGKDIRQKIPDSVRTHRTDITHDKKYALKTDMRWLLSDDMTGI